MRSPRLRKLVFLSTTIGTLIEQYDFLLYGALAATLFNKLFFPSLDPLVGTLASLGTFAIGTTGRPIGAFLGGHFGDRAGRKSMLLIGFTIMGISSAAVGLLPTYATIGIWAPGLLIVLRLLQGISLGIEQSGAAVLAVEHAPPESRGVWGSFPAIGSFAGLLLAYASISLLSKVSGDAFESWGWRIPFLASILLLLIGLLIRSSLPETKAFVDIETNGTKARFPLIDVFRQRPLELLIANTITFSNFGWSTIVLVITGPYMTNYLKLPRSAALDAIAIAAVIAMTISVPIIGRVSDRIGRRPVLLAGGVLLAVTGWPYFALIKTKDTILITVAMVWGVAVVIPLSFGVTSAFFAEMFETNIRLSGFAVGQQIGIMAGGFVVPMFATYVLAKTNGETWPISLFCAGMGGVMIVATLLAKQTRDRMLSGSSALGLPLQSTELL
jgi:MFS transporter, MHS family, shikimate and dehydroshikimate transport protein